MEPSTRIYDEIGIGYSVTRQPDPRIAAQLNRALGDSTSVVNVGAGSGSYEPDDRRVVAVELSATMIRQRPRGCAPAIQGKAETLPFANDAVDAAMAVLTLHHWADAARGLAELRRVARRRVVILTWDPEVTASFWLTQEYFPCIREFDRPREWAIADLVSELGESRVFPVPVPYDCADGFLGAFWRRPNAYLDPQVRAAISGFAVMDATDRDEGLARLAADLGSGAWKERHRELLGLDECDLGYRLVIAELA